MQKYLRTYAALGLISGFCAYSGLLASSNYSDPKNSNLIADGNYPTDNDVCISLESNVVTKPLESDNYFLIACPIHEEAAIDDRKSAQEAKVIAVVENWAILSVPIAYKGRYNSTSYKRERHNLSSIYSNCSDALRHY